MASEDGARTTMRSSCSRLSLLCVRLQCCYPPLGSNTHDTTAMSAPENFSAGVWKNRLSRKGSSGVRLRQISQ